MSANNTIQGRLFIIDGSYQLFMRRRVESLSRYPPDSTNPKTRLRKPRASRHHDEHALHFLSAEVTTWLGHMVLVDCTQTGNNSSLVNYFRSPDRRPDSVESRSPSKGRGHNILSLESGLKYCIWCHDVQLRRHRSCIHNVPPTSVSVFNSAAEVTANIGPSGIIDRQHATGAQDVTFQRLAPRKRRSSSR